jgi:hypothetical protein
MCKIRGTSWGTKESHSDRPYPIKTLRLMFCLFLRNSFFLTLTIRNLAETTLQIF